MAVVLVVHHHNNNHIRYQTLPSFSLPPFTPRSLLLVLLLFLLSSLFAPFSSCPLLILVILVPLLLLLLLPLHDYHYHHLYHRAAYRCHRDHRAITTLNRFAFLCQAHPQGCHPRGRVELCSCRRGRPPHQSADALHLQARRATTLRGSSGEGQDVHDSTAKEAWLTERCRARVRPALND